MKVQKSKSDISKKSKKLKTFDWKDFMYDIRCKLWYAKQRIFLYSPKKAFSQLHDHKEYS